MAAECLPWCVCYAAGMARATRDQQVLILRTPMRAWGIRWGRLVDVDTDEQDQGYEDIADVEFLSQLIGHRQLRDSLVWLRARAQHVLEVPSLDPDTPPQFLVTWKRQEIGVKDRIRQEREWTAGSVELFLALAEECYDNRRIINDVLSDNQTPYTDAAGNPIDETVDSPAGSEPIDSSGPAGSVARASSKRGRSGSPSRSSTF